jgi:type IV pilus assembly protein PilB
VIVEHDKLAKVVEAQGTSANEALESMAGRRLRLRRHRRRHRPGRSADITTEVEDAPVVRFLQKMLIDAINMRASDLHFEPYEYTTACASASTANCARSPSRRSPSRTSWLAHQGHLAHGHRREARPARRPHEAEVRRQGDRLPRQHLPTLFGEKVVIRILDPSSAKLGIEALGYEKIEKDRLMQAIQRPYGMILVTGPTGSGKTVSLYTCLNILNQPGVNISTVEDPAEINLPGINQVNVNDKAGLTFAAALKSFLRQDPDIIMVGEIRDLETADIAIKAAQTGHMVMSTLHTNDAPTTLTRLLNMGVAPFNIASSVLLITAQRLARGCARTARQPRNTRARRCSRPASSIPDRRQLEAVPRGRLFGLQQRLQGPRRPVPGDADHRGDPAHHPGRRLGLDIAEQAQKEGVRDLRSRA